MSGIRQATEPRALAGWQLYAHLTVYPRNIPSGGSDARPEITFLYSYSP